MSGRYTPAILILVTALLCPFFSKAQVVSDLRLGRKNQDLRDSIKSEPYPYFLPILGAKATAKGFDIPLPLGLMVNSMAGYQDIVINNLQLGINGGPMYNFDDVVKFGRTSAQVLNINVRPDVWVFPFLNVYGIFGKSWASPSVELVAPVNFTSSPKLEGLTYGVGVMGAIGLGYLWLNVDFNSTWSYMSNFDHPVNVKIMGIRTGHAFHIPNRPESNIAVWAGITGAFYDGSTSGKIRLGDVIPQASPELIESLKDSASAWYQGLGPGQKAIVREIAEKLQEKMDGKDIRNTEIDYSIDKKAKNTWAMLVGVQYQIDKHWQLRSEVNFLGGRFSQLISANYRFGFKHHHHTH